MSDTPAIPPESNDYAYVPVDDGAAARPKAYPSLAGRGQRLAASLLDSLSLVGPLLFVLIPFYSRGSEFDESDLPTLVIVGLCLLAVGIINIVFVVKDGQSIGKKLLGIYVAREDTGEKASFARMILLRNGVVILIAFIPFVGNIFSLVDTLFILGSEKRCIHDLIASTCVCKRGEPEAA